MDTINFDGFSALSFNTGIRVADITWVGTSAGAVDHSDSTVLVTAPRPLTLTPKADLGLDPHLRDVPATLLRQATVLDRPI